MRLSFPAKPDYLLLARLALSGLAREAPVDEELLADLKLAVTEACGNAVRHAYPEGAGEVCVSYIVGEDSIVMIVEDQGAGIAPDESLERSRLRSTAAWGCRSSVRSWTISDVRTGADGRGTVVRMTKRLNARLELA